MIGISSVSRQSLMESRFLRQIDYNFSVISGLKSLIYSLNPELRKAYMNKPKGENILCTVKNTVCKRL